jgi:hypothetical protein
MVQTFVPAHMARWRSQKLQERPSDERYAASTVIPNPKKKSRNKKRFRLRERGDLSMWSTLFAFGFLIAVALSLAAIRLNL